jgi:RNA polymerase sigma-70 factor (ECF subfamily)
MPETITPRRTPTPPHAAPNPDVPRTPASHARPPRTQEVAGRALDLAYRTALAVVREPVLAGEIAEEVAIAAIRRAGGLRDPSGLDPWLHRTAVRAAITEARRSMTRRGDDDGLGLRPAPIADDLSPGTAPMRRLLAGLPPRQRAAMTLRYVHALDDRQIARAIGWRVGTVRSLLTRGRATLRFVLDQPDAPPRRRAQDEAAFRGLFAPIGDAHPPARAEAAVRQAHTAITGRTSWRSPLHVASTVEWRRARARPHLEPPPPEHDQHAA